MNKTMIEILNNETWIKTFSVNPKDQELDIFWFTKMEDGTHVKRISDLFDLGVQKAMTCAIPARPVIYHVGEFPPATMNALTSWLRTGNVEAIAGKTL